MNNDQKFFTFGCVYCKDFPVGRLRTQGGEGNFEFLPVFPTRLLAELALSDMPTAPLHPHVVVEVSIKSI